VPVGEDVDDAYLVRRAQEGFVDAYADLVDRHGPLAYRVALRRIAIVLRHFEGLSNAEIARITGSSIPAVRSHLFRGRRTLSETLEAWR
jgi:hypothetical protein